MYVYVFYSLPIILAFLTALLYNFTVWQRNNYFINKNHTAPLRI
jgi:hypothetical protein